MFLVWSSIAVTVIVIAIMIAAYTKEHKSKWPEYDYIVFGGFTLIVILVAALVFSAFTVSFCLDKHDVVVETKNLVSLQDGSSVEGSFFLGCGTINEKPSYTYYVKTGENQFVLKSVGAEYCTVVYTTGKPCIKTIRKSFNSDTLNYWFFQNTGYDRYQLCVPEGSIKSNYILDAK